MKRKFNHFYLSLLGGALLTLGACNDKNDDITPLPQTPENVGIFVLNEGASQNSNLGFFSYGTSAYSANAYAGSLGNGGNDMVRYGSKLYISVTDANKVVILDAASKEELETLNISLPRYLLAYRGKVYVTSHGNDELTALDTASYATNSVEVGHTPEQLTATNGKIYVANSGWREAINGGEYDNRISVVNPSNLTVEKNITVAENISTIVADTVKNVLYVNASAIYDGNEIVKPSKLYIVNTSNDDVQAMDFGAERIAIVSEIKRAYLISSNRTTGDKNTLISLNLDDRTAQNITSTSLEQPYSITFLPEVARLIIGDAKDYQNNGKVNIFGLYTSGEIALEYAFDAGVSPVKFAFSHNVNQ